MGYVGKVKTGEVTNAIGATLFGVCKTDPNVREKVAVIPELLTIDNMDGLTIHVYFANSNTIADTSSAHITLRIDSAESNAQTLVPPRQIMLAGSVTVGNTPETSWNAGSVLSLTYHAVENAAGKWFIDGWLNTNTTYPVATASRDGLMPSSAVIALGNIVPTNNYILTNISVPASWTDDTSVNGGPKYPDYPKKTTVSITGVSSSMVPTVVFDPAVSAEYGIAPVAEAAANSLTLYAEAAPAAAITILTLVLQSGHGTM